MKNSPFLPFLRGIIPNIVVTALFIVLLLFGVPFALLLMVYCAYLALRSYYDRKTPVQYLKSMLVLLLSIVAMVWIYYFTGGYGILGLVLGVLIVAGILVYRRRKLILTLVRLWEKTFLGSTMEERLEKKREAK